METNNPNVPRYLCTAGWFCSERWFEAEFIMQPGPRIAGGA